MNTYKKLTNGTIRTLGTDGSLVGSLKTGSETVEVGRGKRRIQVATLDLNGKKLKVVLNERELAKERKGVTRALIKAGFDARNDDLVDLSQLECKVKQALGRKGLSEERRTELEKLLVKVKVAEAMESNPKLKGLRYEDHRFFVKRRGDEEGYVPGLRNGFLKVLEGTGIKDFTIEDYEALHDASTEGVIKKVIKKEYTGSGWSLGIRSVEIKERFMRGITPDLVGAPSHLRHFPFPKPLRKGSEGYKDIINRGKDQFHLEGLLPNAIKVNEQERRTPFFYDVIEKRLVYRNPYLRYKAALTEVLERVKSYAKSEENPVKRLMAYAYFAREALLIHGFRDGNRRTIVLFLYQMVLHDKGLPMLCLPSRDLSVLNGPSEMVYRLLEAMDYFAHIYYGVGDMFYRNSTAELENYSMSKYLKAYLKELRLGSFEKALAEAKGFFADKKYAYFHELMGSQKISEQEKKSSD